jgi:hypothetical protein
MLPQPLIEQYWQEVENELVERYHHSRASATQGIAEYRRRLAVHGVGDMAYHASAHSAAEVVDAGIQYGFPNFQMQP